MMMMRIVIDVGRELFGGSSLQYTDASTEIDVFRFSEKSPCF